MKAWKDFAITIAGVSLVGIAIYLAVTWFGRKEPVTYLGDMVIRGNTISNTISNTSSRRILPAELWDEGKVYVSVRWWSSNMVVGYEYRLTNTLEEVAAWVFPRSDNPPSWIQIDGTNVIELKGISLAPITYGPMRP